MTEPEKGTGQALATQLAAMPFKIEEVPLADLKPHPENYQEHPPDQIEHLRASLRKWGPFRNAVIARDNTLLAGHGITEAARQEGYETWPCKRYDLDPYDPLALGLLAADNESGNLAMRDDTGLVAILKQVQAADPVGGLPGTGFDHMMLANLASVVRPPDDIAPHNEGDHWVGLPDYEPAQTPFKVIVQCDTPEERREFLSMIGADRDPQHTMVQTRHAISMWWPLRDVKPDRKHVRWGEVSEASEAEEDDGTPGLVDDDD